MREWLASVSEFHVGRCTRSAWKLGQMARSDIRSGSAALLLVVLQLNVTRPGALSGAWLLRGTRVSATRCNQQAE